MEEIIISRIEKFSSLDDFYVGNDIPEKKLYNAIKSYPIDHTDVVLALADATVFGSAKNGVAIGIKGVYWRNDFMKESEKRFISWSEIDESEIKPTLFGSVIIGSGCKIDLSGSKLKSKQLVEILISTLKAIQEHNQSQKNKTKIDGNNTDHLDIKENILNDILQDKPVPREAQIENYKYYLSNYQTNYFFLEAVNFLYKKYSPPAYLSVAPRVLIDPQKINLALDVRYEKILLCALDHISKQILILTNSEIIAFGSVANSIKEIKKIGSLEHKNSTILVDGEIFYKFSECSQSDESSVYNLINEALQFIRFFELKEMLQFSSEAEIKAPVSTCLFAAAAEVERALLEHLGIEENHKEINEDEEVFIQILRKISDSVKVSLCMSIYNYSKINLSEEYSKRLLRATISTICSILPALSHALDCDDREDGLMRLLKGAAILIAKNALSLSNSISQVSIDEQELEVFSAVVEFGIEYSSSKYSREELDNHSARFTRLILEFYEDEVFSLDHEAIELRTQDILVGMSASKEIANLKILFD